jgi:hypothetical protein
MLTGAGTPSQFLSLLLLAAAMQGRAMAEGQSVTSPISKVEFTSTGWLGGFEENVGQTDPRVRFLARAPSYTLFLTATEVVIVVSQRSPKARLGDELDGLRQVDHHHSRSAVLRMKFVGANPHAGAARSGELPARSSYFIGSDPRGWHVNVRRYARVEFGEIYPGMGVVWSSAGGEPQLGFVAAPDAEIGAVRIEVAGAERLGCDETGNLVAHTPAGNVRLAAPVVQRREGGKTRRLRAAYQLRGEREVGVDLAAGDDGSVSDAPPSADVSFFGGSRQDIAYDVAVDGEGRVFVAGVTNSIDFPIKGGIGSPHRGGSDAFVARLDSIDLSLVYATYLGGGAFDVAREIAFDGDGNVYLAGYTESGDFPVTGGALQPRHGGEADAFLVKLSASGDALLYSTYIGGSQADFASGLAVDADGNLVLGGLTQSRDFPVADPLQSSLHGQSDGFVTKVNASGSRLFYSTFLGGSGDDLGRELVVDRSGSAYLLGTTSSSDFPTAGAFQLRHGGGTWDVFVTKINPVGSSLLYSTYLGGNDDDFPGSAGLVVDHEGSAYVTGRTRSRNFPLVSPLQPQHGGGNDDVFVAKLTPDGEALAYSTYLGGSGFLGDFGDGIAVDEDGNAYVVGTTSSADFPQVNPLQAAGGGFFDAFVAKLDRAGSRLLYSSFLGGSHFDNGRAVATGGDGIVYVVGDTFSRDWPFVEGVGGSAQMALPGDAFVVRIAEITPTETPTATPTPTLSATPSGTATITATPPPSGTGGNHGCALVPSRRSTWPGVWLAILVTRALFARPRTLSGGSGGARSKTSRTGRERGTDG